MLGGALHADDHYSDEAVSFFESRIRPVLIEHCYECHNSADSSEGELAVDHRQAMLVGGSLGSLFSTEAPRNSLLLRVLRHEVEGLEMPESGPKLSEAIIEDFEKWIAMGAPDTRASAPSPDELNQVTSWDAIRQRRQQWWSFQPIQPGEPPESAEQHGLHPVDRFIRAKLNKAGLSPAPRAEKLTLLRRTTFALTGLPPTRSQVDSFVGDSAPDAFERLVDSLLASDAFGERWARHWMDWIRYAESHGSEGDPLIAEAWRYRDYLIRALNDDVPYNQLVREHIAGDLLSAPRVNDQLGINESLVATAHWRMVFHGFAPTDALDEKVRFTDDAIDVFSKAFLGLTVSCARCHNHKFDAISQADYYALFGIFGSTRPGRAVIDLPARLDPGRARLGELKREIRRQLARDWIAWLPTLGDQLRSDDGPWKEADHPRFLLHPLFILHRDAAGDQFAKAWQQQRETIAKELRQHDEFQPARLWNFADDATVASAFRYGHGIPAQPIPAGGFAIEPAGDTVLKGIYPAAVYSHALSDKDPGRLTVEDFALDKNYQLWLRVAGGGGAMARYVVQNYPRSGTVYPVKEFKTAQDATWQWHKFDLNYWRGDEVHFELCTARDAPLLAAQNDRSWFAIRRAVLVEEGTAPPQLEPREYLRPLLEATRRRPPTSTDDVVDCFIEAIRDAVVAWQDAALTDEQALMLDLCLRQGLLPNGLDASPRLHELVGQYRQLESAMPIPTRVPSLDEWKGQDQRLFVRGNHKIPADPIPRRFLEAFDATPYETSKSGRLQLAEDVLSDRNPLLRRVIVNRLWHHLFGSGIVDTPNNFGRLGSLPSHPQLLDHLAARFSGEDGWSLKRQIRFLVTSQTWRQASRPSAAARQIDPENRLLSHANVNRLEAEAIRDALLATSGKLKQDLFGPPVPGNADRRSVYVNVTRNSLDPFLSAFDAPVPFSSKGRRDVTNVPAQSLMMLNNPFVAGAAAELADAVVRSAPGASPQQWIESLWSRVLARKPSPAEVTFATNLLHDLEDQYRRDHAARKNLQNQISELDSAVSEILTPVQMRLEGASHTPPELHPIAFWNFDGDLRDSVGELHAAAIGSAKVSGDSLVLDGNGFVATAPLVETLLEKSLEVTVLLTDLDQRGGGAITLQTNDGQLFDSVVFAERQPRRWLAGSNFHQRSKDFGGTDESDLGSAPVHIVITFAGDGTITGYRNGQLYGQPYRVDLQRFEGGRSQVLFGLRHGTSVTGNRTLRGRILSAGLYDRALSADEVAAAAEASLQHVSDEQLVAELSDPQRRRWNQLQSSLGAARQQLDALGSPPAANQPYRDLAHSLYNLKEFIYVR